MSDLIWTPLTLATRMVSEIDPKYSASILEPHAGIGSLAKEVRSAFPNAALSCGEIDKELVMDLRAKGYATAHEDFLNNNCHGRYDTIIMSPPFCNNADATHILHAWSLLDEGDVVAIASAKTVRSPKLPAQIKLAELAGNEVTYLSNAFDNTDVEIALVHLRKRRK